MLMLNPQQPDDRKPAHMGQMYPSPVSWPTAPVVFPAPSRPTKSPLRTEMTLNVLGIFGVGWLMLGKKVVGSILLLLSVLLWPVMVVLAILTMGLALLFLGPLLILGNYVVFQRVMATHDASSERRW